MKLDHYCFHVSIPSEDQKKGLHGKFEKFLSPKASKDQRWSPRGRPWPRGHILKSLALASRSQVLENWPFLGSKTALFFERLKFCRALEKFFGKRFFVEIDFFFLESTCACVLGLEGVCPQKDCPWPWPRIFLRPWPRIFLRPWPWPRAFCPRLHLW